MFLGEVGFLATLGVGVGFFCPTPNAQVDHFLHHTPKMGILGKMIQFLLQFVETIIPSCVPRFPLILSQISFILWSRKFWKFAESEILAGVGDFGKVGYFTSDSATLLSRMDT